jgi:single-strand DNA-binding protein
MNLVAITGHLTADPARKETSKGVVTTFRVGSDDSPRVWVDVEAWGHLAGTCAAHLARGRHIAVSGTLAHTQWTDRVGERRERWFIRAAQVTFLDSPPTATGDDRARVAQPA